ncbi:MULTISPECIES: hypothetical protein [Proteiniclasticum]|jgi:hypothetical protein|uniref:FlgN protein n=1 Tax=Proteiniclasticum ruminis TaxID=398199 RepID=A0A1I5CB36_9CLOT|nr:MULTISPECIES: hypothetical protein [Proteiniclasticum]SFN84183.1 hypothetical protein SAMN04488695_10650 [Proteiniclasticum ruminis]
MSDTKRLQGALKDLLKILKEEKEVLVKNDALSLEKIVARKNEIVTIIREEQEKGVLPDEAVRSYAMEIEKLQEVNQLLTRQALSFQEEIFKALSKNTAVKHNTYSKEGSMNRTKEVSIIDQSV